jgi:hypothetical protein
MRDWVDKCTAEVVPALRSGDVRCVLLKGPTVTGWLYGDRTDRAYSDVDLLISPLSIDAAGTHLTDMGFRCNHDDRGYAAEPHAQLWSRAGSPIVDLHWRLPLIGADAEQAWRVLSSRTVSVRVADAECESLDPSARAFHVALHVAQHLEGTPQVVRDLDAALTRIPRSTWEEAANLARELDAVAGFVAGLRRTGEGAAMASALGLPAASADEAWLGGQPVPYGALALRHALSAGTPRDRARRLWRAAFPPATYMRISQPVANRGRLGLTTAYVSRLARGVRSAPRAWRWWRQSRRRRSY